MHARESLIYTEFQDLTRHAGEARRFISCGKDPEAHGHVDSIERIADRFPFQPNASARFNEARSLCQCGVAYMAMHYAQAATSLGGPAEAIEICKKQFLRGPVADALDRFLNTR